MPSTSQNIGEHTSGFLCCVFGTAALLLLWCAWNKSNYFCCTVLLICATAVPAVIIMQTVSYTDKSQM